MYDNPERGGGNECGLMEQIVGPIGHGQNHGVSHSHILACLSSLQTPTRRRIPLPPSPSELPSAGRHTSHAPCSPQARPSGYRAAPATLSLKMQPTTTPRAYPSFGSGFGSGSGSGFSSGFGSGFGPCFGFGGSDRGDIPAFGAPAAPAVAGHFGAPLSPTQRINGAITAWRQGW